MNNMEPFLKGKLALVTGGTRGIGREIAQKLLDAGANVAISGHSEDSVVRALAEFQTHGNKVVGKAADVRTYDEVSGLFRFTDTELGGLDILVNNAGVGVFRPTADLAIEEWQRVVETNLTGAFYCTREALFRFRIRRGGYVVNISSLAGKNAFAGGAAYNASKFGLNGFTEAVMLDHRYENVRVSSIMPGSVDTEFGGSNTGAAWKIWPEDIAEIVLMLLRTPERTLISRVEVRPSQPKRN
jgi:NAD(P)-dependent dehydrogenase (short-subunit alcohol dehydrogenase family)